jgi:predicted AAA+ superfamily ATPase
MAQIDRQSLTQHLTDSMDHFRVTAFLGPRQCGKTTLARTFEVPRENYFAIRATARPGRALRWNNSAPT